MKQRTLSLAALLLLATSAFVFPRLAASAAFVPTTDPEPQRARQQRRGRARRAPRTPARARVDYTKFSHRTPKHREDSCDSCHKSPTENWARVRDKEAAFPDITDYPAHESCLDCHRRQFFSGARPAICSVCHTTVSPRSGALFPFANPEEAYAKSEKSKGRPSQFRLHFPHDRHQDVMARVIPSYKSKGGATFARAAFRQEEKRRVDSCSLCHQTYMPMGDPPKEFVTDPPADNPEGAFWMKRGMLKTTPSSHASCFNCHWQDGGERPLSSDCAGCHKLLPEVAGVRYGGATDADPANPSAKGLADAAVLRHWTERKAARFLHEQSSHQGAACTACHVTVTASDEINADTLFVPIQTCSSTACHGRSATTGGKNHIFVEVQQKKKDANFLCSKCHINLGKEATPASHAALFPPK